MLTFAGRCRGKSCLEVEAATVSFKLAGFPPVSKETQ